MILLNFSHPVSPQQLAQIQALAGRPVDRVVSFKTQLDQSDSFKTQISKLFLDAGLDAVEWQTQPILVNLPSLTSAAGVVLSEIHGRAGYFPPILRFRQTQGSLPPVYEVAEILNLQEIRNSAREQR